MIRSGKLQRSAAVATAMHGNKIGSDERFVVLIRIRGHRQQFNIHRDQHIGDIPQCLRDPVRIFLGMLSGSTLGPVTRGHLWRTPAIDAAGIHINDGHIVGLCTGECPGDELFQ